MFDFRLQVFHTVAKRLNFSKAAKELFISQPAVTRHIRETESYFKVKLFDRNGNKIKLTTAGTTLLQYTDQLFGLYRNMEFDLGSLAKTYTGELRVGASTTVAQYVLPPVLAAFHKKFKKVKVSLKTGNTEQIEKALQEKNIDLGIIEGQSKNPLFKYTEFIKDELVLVAGIDNPWAKKQAIKPEDLLKVPLLLREQGSGTLDVLAHAIKPLGIKISQLKTEMQLGSSESIKHYLLNSDALAFLSVYAILKELKSRECCIVDVKDLNIERHFYFIQAHGQEAALPVLFLKFAQHYNFR